MADNETNVMPQIPTGVLDNVNEMLELGNDELSEENGRLCEEELNSLKEKMKSELDMISKNFILDLNNLCNNDTICEKENIAFDKAFKDFGLKLVAKLALRYQNAHERITYKTVVGYVFQEIKQSEITEIVDYTSKLVENKENNIKAIVEDNLKSLEEKFKVIYIESENKKSEEDIKIINEINSGIQDPKFVENTTKKVEYMLENEGKKSMMKYVKNLAQALVEANRK